MPDPRYNYTKELNWQRCGKKDRCRVLSKEGLYRCFVLHAEDEDLCTMESQNQVKDYIERNTAFDFCGKCPMPPKRMK